MVLKPSTLRPKPQQSLQRRRIVSSLCLLLPASAKSHWIEPSFVLATGAPGNNNHLSPTRNPLARKVIGSTRELTSSFHNSNMPEQYDFKSSALSMAKLESPSAQRNKNFIWDILSQKIFSTMPSEKTLRILEIAAGSGVHVEHFASELASSMIKKESGLSSFVWYPTDLDESSRKSIECYIQDGKLNEMGVQPPLSLTLDESGIMEKETSSVLFPPAAEDTVKNTSLDLMICINMIHISPWGATLGLMKLAGERLDEGNGLLFCYGPYKEGGTAVESNLNFDQSLQSRNPEWGVRDLEDVCQAASVQGLELVEKTEMPANNLSLLFRKKKEP